MTAHRTMPTLAPGASSAAEYAVSLDGRDSNAGTAIHGSTRSTVSMGARKIQAVSSAGEKLQSNPPM